MLQHATQADLDKLFLVHWRREQHFPWDQMSCGARLGDVKPVGALWVSDERPEPCVPVLDAGAPPASLHVSVSWRFNSRHPWQRVATNFHSADDALAFIAAAMKDGVPPLIDAGVGFFLLVINPQPHA